MFNALEWATTIEFGGVYLILNDKYVVQVGVIGSKGDYYIVEWYDFCKPMEWCDCLGYNYRKMCSHFKKALKFMKWINGEEWDGVVNGKMESKGN